MRFAAGVLTALPLLDSSARVGSQDRPTPQSSFRTGIDLVYVDVSVLDSDRRPVRGLQAADFVVREDGRPRPIAAFSAVDPRCSISIARRRRRTVCDPRGRGIYLPIVIEARANRGHMRESCRAF